MSEHDQVAYERIMEWLAFEHEMRRPFLLLWVRLGESLEEAIDRTMGGNPMPAEMLVLPLLELMPEHLA